MDFSEIASVSGKGGLYRVVNPTRSGVILEALDETKQKIVAGMTTKVSVLSDISIYITDGEGAVPLQEVLAKIHKEFKGDTGLDKNASSDELRSFLKHILANYDEDRVYVSDIKKLVTWYNLLAQIAPDLLVVKKAAKGDKGEITDKKAKTLVKKSTPMKSQAKPSAKKAAPNKTIQRKSGS